MKKVLSAFVGIAALLLASCVRDTPMQEQHRPTGETMRMRVEVPEMSGGNSGDKTRSIAPEEGEDRVQTLYLLFFEPSANGTGKFLNYLPVNVNDFTPVSEDGMMGMAIDVDIEFGRARSGIVDTEEATTTWGALSTSAAYNILGIANIKDNHYISGTVDKWMGEFRLENVSEREVIAESRVGLPSSITPDAILMHGRMEKPAGETQLHMVLGRDLARFDVNNEARENFDLISVSIWNAYPSSSIWERGILDYSRDIERVRRHYQINNDGNLVLLDPNDPTSIDPRELMDDIRGGLYAFENQVSSPVQDDKVTTALVVGMRERVGGTDFDSDGELDVYYYRVNMTSDTGAQDLRRNNIYTLNIKSVQEIGWATEEDAYLGQINGLTYTINEWNRDTNGLVVENEHSMLSIPTKRVTMGAGEGVNSLIEVELSVNTFTTLPSPAPLRVQSQTYRPASIGDDGFEELGGSPIQAYLDNNTLIIQAKGLDTHETERSGQIVLSYAGLEIALTVVQSGYHDKYLNLTLPDGGIPRFPAYPGISSGLINVEATGPWVARLVMSGFSFNSSSSLPEVKTLYSTDASVVTDESNSAIKKFRVYTNSFNETQSVRDALIIVTLLEKDEDPLSPTFGEYVIENDDYTALVRLSQANVEKIHLAYNATDAANPDLETNHWQTSVIVQFDGNGNPVGQNKFWVVPGRDASNNIRGWSTGKSLELSGNSDDRAYFMVSDKSTSPSDPADNWVEVAAVGQNSSGRTREAIVRVQVDQGTFADIRMVQPSLSMSIQPAILTSVASPYGGHSEWISVELEGAAGNTKYTLDEMQLSVNRSRNGRSLQGHDMPIYEVREINNDTTIRDYVPGEELPLNYQFRVKFAQIYYPNRGISVGAVVTARIGGMTQSASAVQNPLLARGINTAGYGHYQYAGSIDTRGDYMGWYRDNIRSIPGFNQVIDNTAFNANSIAQVSSSSTPVTYIHLNTWDMYTHDTWSNANMSATRSGMLWMDNNNNGGVTMVVLDQDDSRIINRINSYILSDMGYSAHTSEGHNGGQVGVLGNKGQNNTKIWQFFVSKPYYGAPYTSITPTSGDGINTTLSLTPESAVTILQYNNSAAGPLLTVDPVNRFIFLGDAHALENNDLSSPASNNALGWALRIWVAKAAQYGSSFTDMFIEDGKPNAVPAPWDEHWGNNALDLRDNNQDGPYGIRSNPSDD